MNTEEFKRKLTAILSADVEGYSLLMRDDEEATIRTLTTYRTAMTGLIQQYRGRVVDSPGDNMLAEFTSAVDAVNCAVEIQRELAERNAELPESRRMEFRIGVNVGDVVEEGERIYGDGVNIAARMEGLSEGGGICISGTAYDQVKHKLGLEYEYLGEQEVKNITEPVPAYRVLSFPGAAAHRVVKAKRAVGKIWRNVMLAIVSVLVVGAAVAVWHFYFRPPPLEPASVERMAHPLPDKPSIAVLPFVNMSEDPKQDYLADGITENIISALSHVPKLFVIARNSTYTYKGKPVKVQKVAEDLGVQYVLEGSVQRSGDILRITAQLIDAITGHHLWSERYDRELKNIFALQDEITIKIITALRVSLTDGELARLRAKGTENLQAYLKYLQAREPLFTQTREGTAQARLLLEEAIALDPEFPAAHFLLGSTYLMDVSIGSSKSPEKSLNRAFESIKRAKALDDSSAFAHSLLGWLYILMEMNYDKAIAECERAIELAPNSASSHIWMGMVLTLAGRHEEGVRHCELALRLNPRPEVFYFQFLGWAYFFAGRYEEAIAAHKKELHGTPNNVLTHEGLTTAYSWAGRLEEARTQAAQILTINPNYSLEQRAKILLAKNQADRERWLDGLRKAGLPETPPLPLPDKPSIAVLPFVNMSGDPKQEYFSDGITEEIITALSKTPKLFVIARTSSFKYKGKEVDVRTVGRELGVRYVLEGSVRKSEDRLRLTAQLVDGKSGNHVWAERYDRDLEDIFAIQDEITLKIITELQVKLTDGEQARLMAKGTDNLAAYLKLLKGNQYFIRMNKEDNAFARKMAEEAIALDPDFPTPYVLLGWAYYMEIYYRTSKSPKQSVARAIELAQKSLEMDSDQPAGHSLLCHIHTFKREYEKAIAEGERAVAINPNGPGAHVLLARSLLWAGRNKESIALIKKAIRLNPYPASFYYYILGECYIAAGQFEEAITVSNKAVQLEPDSLWARIALTSGYGLLGREEEARASAAEVLRIEPKFSLQQYAKRLPFKRPSDKDRFIEGLLKAGLK